MCEQLLANPLIETLRDRARAMSARARARGSPSSSSPARTTTATRRSRSSALGAEPRLVWHAERGAAGRSTAVVLPGGFSYGDYLRCGAIARFAPVMRRRAPVRRRRRARARDLQRLPDPLRGRPAARACCARTRRSRSSAATCRSGSSAPTRRSRPRCEPGQRLVDPGQARRGLLDFADDELLARARGATARSCSATTARTRTARSPTSPASSNATGNVMGLMPHPEHAVDPLLGSTDGALILGSLVDAARERLARRRLDAFEPERRRQLAGRFASAVAQPLEVARAQRHRPAPRRAAGRVREAGRAARRLAPRAAGRPTRSASRPRAGRSVSSSTSSAGPHGVAAFAMQRP